MMQADIAVIGGSGFYDLDLEEVGQVTIDTVYGEAQANIGLLEGKRVAFMPRHGAGHTVPPHLVNYRANIAALEKIGVHKVLATVSVGSLNMDMEPGHLVVVDQFIDFTKNRPLTFYEGGQSGVVHTDMTNPYCSQLRELLIKASKGLNRTVHSHGVYVCTEGPRFESSAEINMFRILGGDMVGMTNVPEVVLAREKGLCYAAVAVVTNYAAGISPRPLSHDEVLAEMSSSRTDLRELLRHVIRNASTEKDCLCCCGAGDREEG